MLLLWKNYALKSFICIKFGGKYAYYGEWLCSDVNMKFPAYVKEGGLKKKEADVAFVSGFGNVVEKRKISEG